MKRIILIIFETLIIILIILGIFSIIFSCYFIFKDSGKIVLNINDNNREVVEDMLKQSNYYDNSNDINNLRKIQFFLVFNDYEFTLYYKNGEEIELYDDGLYDLREYIEQKGTSKTLKYIVGDGLILPIIIFLNLKRKKLADKIATK